MRTRSPDIGNVGGSHQHGDVHFVNHYSFDGVTPNAVAQIAPRLTSSQIDQSRATVPRTMT